MQYKNDWIKEFLWGREFIKGEIPLESVAEWNQLKYFEAKR